MADTALNPEYEEPEAFPVGAPDGGEANIEIEVLDDTPVEDRESPRPAADRLDLDSDEFEEEIKDYSENAQQRIKALKFEYHEERRAKESALRQNEEAVRYAEAVAADNAHLKEGLSNTNDVLIQQYGARSDAELETARSSFKEAYEGGDTDELLKAQETISRLHAERAKGLVDAGNSEAAAISTAASTAGPAAKSPTASAGLSCDGMAEEELLVSGCGQRRHDWLRSRLAPEVSGRGTEPPTSRRILYKD